MRTVLFLLMLSVCTPTLCLAADDPAETACHNADNTMAITDCLGKLATQWDKRLNTAYQGALRTAENEAHKSALIRAERAWLNYRKENCGWYGAQEGTISQISFSDCMLDMTRSRAIELGASSQH